MNIKLTLLIFTFITSSFYCQKIESNYVIGKNYDARIFLTNTQKVTFNRIFLNFDSKIIDLNYEWNDVDPLKIFNFEENRHNRRNMFLYELDHQKIGYSKPMDQQNAFKLIIEKNIVHAVVLLDSRDIKISVPYTTTYENVKVSNSLLEKLADLGLQWSQLDGNNLYIYNGNILVGKFKSGYVSLVNLKIDNP